MAEISRMKVYAAEVLCLLEKALPPLFFDIQIHVLVHLVEEVEICGPVHARWMYWLERYMGTLKNLVKQRAHPEGSMAVGYLNYESMFFCSQILKEMDIECDAGIVNDDTLEARETEEILLGHAEKRRLTAVEFEQIHTFILHNSEILTPWLDR